MSGFYLQELTGSILSDQNIFQEVLSLITDNVQSLRFEVIEKNTPISDFYSALEAEIIGSTLIRVDANDATRVYGTIVRDEIGDNIVAFALFYPVLDSNQEVTKNINLAKLVVHEKYRNKGVSGIIIDYLKSKFKGITLTCSPNLVAFYEKEGFKVIDTFESQLFMAYGEKEPENAQIAMIYDETVMNSPVGPEILNNIFTKHGKSEFFASQEECLRNTEVQKKKVNELYSKNYV